MALSPVPEKSYREFVEERFDEARDSTARVVFTNRGSTDARVVLKAFLHNATKSLEIYAGCLPSEVYDPRALIGAAKRLPQGSIRILVANRPLGESSALFDLKEEATTGTIVVKQYQEASRENAETRYQHFAICDGKHFRIERDHFDKTAVIILNGSAEKVAKEYTALFEELWVRASPVDWSRINVRTAAVA
jgi:hypothetical protein